MMLKKRIQNKTSQLVIKTKKTIFPFGLALSLFLLPQIAFSQGVNIGAPFPGEPTNVTFEAHTFYIFKWAASIGSLLAMLMIIYAGIKYMSSGGNPQVLEDAKETIVGSLIGLGMIILAYFLLKTIGVNVVGGRV